MPLNLQISQPELKFGHFCRINKQKWKIVAGVCGLLFGFFLNIDTVHAQSGCNAFDAIYSPHPAYKLDRAEKNYQIRIERNAEYVPTAGAKFFFILDTYIGGTENAASSYKMGYFCTGGAHTRCYLDGEGGALAKRLSVQALNKDFSSASYLAGEAPYALIIPNSNAVFGALDWEAIKAIEYHQANLQKESLRPDFSVPSIWLLSGCK